MTGAGLDAIVIGTGFAGAVTACRLVEAGLRIAILERGRRYEADDFPVHASLFPAASEAGSVPDLSQIAWRLGGGLWDFRDLGDVVIAQAAGYGGGSLVYANVHLRAPPEVFEQSWPREYRDLERYYDLAAFMLDVAPIPEKRLPRKTRALRDAAQRCASAGRAGFSFFRPPLAVRFPGDVGHADARRPQDHETAGCDGCGECGFGCSKHARNTLDTNYLARAEKAMASDGTHLADLRTQAEVVEIRRTTGANEPGYVVEYLDHCLGARGEPCRVEAPVVFLCAGAVQTTELLLRGKRSGELLISSPELGRRFHTNADAPAVVFDCEELQESDTGPTIAGALLHRSEGEWLMVQDGGLPEALEPLLGLYRSPLCAGRNRFREAERHSERALADTVRAPRPPWAPLPLGGLRGALGAFGRGSSSPERALADLLGAELLELARGESRTPRRWRLPDPLRSALSVGREDLLQALSNAAEPLVERFVERLAQRLRDTGALDSLLGRLRLEELDGVDLRALDLEARLLRLAVQQVFGSQAGLIHELVSFLLEELLPDRETALDHAAGALRFALDYRFADGHSAILLSMGRDRVPGRLELDAEGHLVAKLPSRLESPETLLQERLLRDLAACGLRGELRTNPAWTLLDRRFTVHAQGGAPMGEPANGGVCDPDGSVRGCPGLYVMDAAAFPSPVGVNPSATITAIAELKIERFLRAHLGDESWRARESGEAARWAATRRDALDPLSRPECRSGSRGPASRAIGIAFSEEMAGCHGPPFEGHDPRRYRATERRGIEDSATLELDLHGTIDDLTGFLARHERLGRDARRSGAGDVDAASIPVTGWVHATRLPGVPAGRRSFSVGPESSIALLAPSDLGESAGSGQRSIEYRLHFGEPPRLWRLDGKKLLYDDPGLDAFEDATTLYFDLYCNDHHERSGVLRLPTHALFGRQIPSFEATGTTDPVRRAWALASFGRFFFGHLAKIYLPDTAHAVPLLFRAALRGHV